MLEFEFTFGHVSPQVVVSEEYNIAQLHFDIKKETHLKQPRRSNSGHSSMEVLIFLLACLQVVLLGKSNIALFALRFTFGHIGGDTVEAVMEEQFWSQRFCCCFFKCVLWLCLQGTIFWTLLCRFCNLYTCALRLCFWTNIILLCLHLDFHLVP